VVDDEAGPWAEALGAGTPLAVTGEDQQVGPGDGLDDLVLDASAPRQRLRRPPQPRGRVLEQGVGGLVGDPLQRAGRVDGGARAGRGGGSRPARTAR
jgi:hypothetical protein